ncbi:MAG: 30S ribosomal protein S18 [Chloroflexi bacterium]|nr:30S ribosomal protein S18 [Chloroflexota bacterium]
MADNDSKNKSEDVKKENGATTQVASSPQSTYAQGGRRKGRFFARKKVCPFTVDPTLVIDYKDSEFLSRFIDDRGKILSTRRSGVSPKYQRRLAKAIKQARFLALLPYTLGHVITSGVRPSGRRR